MASALRKLFKSSERHRSGERTGGWRRKNNNSSNNSSNNSNNNNNNTSNRGGSTDSPTHHKESAAMRFFGHCPSPRLPKRDTNKISPEDSANSQKVVPGGIGSSKESVSSSAAVDSPSRGVRFKSSKNSKTSTKAPEAKTVRTRRLMKEFQEINKISRNLEKPPFVVELVDDNLYEWNVKLFQIDPESDFYHDMQEADIGHVLLNMIFPENFPFSPPFVRVISPHVEKGFVMEGGAICMELLTPRGWASAYTVEAVVMQFSASLVKGQGRIARKSKSGKEFSRKSAEASFRSLVKTHDKYGWVTPPLADG